MEKKTIAKNWRWLMVAAFIFVTGPLVFLLFSQFDPSIAQDYVLTLKKETDVTYFTWNDDNERIVLNANYDAGGFLLDIEKPAALTGNQQPHFGLSLVLSEESLEPLIYLTDMWDDQFIIFLDEKVIYTDIAAENLGPDNLPISVEERDEIYSNVGYRVLTFSLPADCVGKTLTIAKYSPTYRSDEEWYPPYASIINSETERLEHVSIAAPRLILSGVALSALILLTALFIWNLVQEVKPWPLLLPIFYVLTQMFSMAQNIRFLDPNYSQEIYPFIYALHSYCMADCLFVFLGLKMRTKARYSLIIASALHFIVITLYLLWQFFHGGYLDIENVYAPGVSFLLFMLSVILMFLERKNNPYFKHVALIIAVFAAGFGGLTIYFRFANYAMYIELYSMVEAIFMFNFLPIMKILPTLILILIILFSVREYIFDRVEEQARLNSLEQINRLKSEFLGTVAHELKTPLAVVSGYAQDSERRVLSAGLDKQLVAGQMQIISSEAERLALMVSQILDITRIDEGRMAIKQRPISLVELIQDTVDMYYPVMNKNQNTISLSLDPGIPTVFVDKARISQVLLNLLSNAVRHTHKGNLIIAVKTLGDFVEISVTDNGEGIDPAIMPELFERYKSHTGDEKETSPFNKGTGLGLYICKYIVEAHGGKIEAQSQKEEGTTLRFTVPVYKPAP